MSSTLAIRSHPNTRYKPYAPYPASEASQTSTSVAEARQHRPATQDGYWQTPCPAVTYLSAGTKVYNPYATRDETDDSSVTHSYQYPSADYQIAPSPPEDTLPATHDLAFPLSSTAGGFGGHLVAERTAEISQGRYFGSSSIHCYESERISQPPLAQPAFTSLAEAPTGYAYAEFTNSSLSSSTQPILQSDQAAAAPPYNDGYQSDVASVHSRPMSSYAHSGFTTSRPHSSYNNEPYAFPSHAVYTERRASIVSSISHDETFAYQTVDAQGDAYVRPGYGLIQHTACSPPAAPTPTSSAAIPPDAEEQQSRSSPPSPHTLVDSPPRGSSTPAQVEHPQSAPPSTTSSPLVPDIGPPKSVQRRLGIMMDAQRQQSEQREVFNQTPKRTRKKSASVSTRARRHEPEQSDESESDSKSSDTSKTKLKEPATRYKAAYERVRLQRNFFENATASLLHQVRMLGGDPMQASDRASKGEDMDHKKSRILVASLQRDLENSRERVIEIQTELYRLRQIVEDTQRPQYLLDGDEARAPLSAAPKTLYAHLKK